MRANVYAAGFDSSRNIFLGVSQRRDGTGRGGTGLEGGSCGRAWSGLLSAFQGGVRGISLGAERTCSSAASVGGVVCHRQLCAAGVSCSHTSAAVPPQAACPGDGGSSGGRGILSYRRSPSHTHTPALMPTHCPSLSRTRRTPLMSTRPPPASINSHPSPVPRPAGEGDQVGDGRHHRRPHHQRHPADAPAGLVLRRPRPARRLDGGVGRRRHVRPESHPLRRPEGPQGAWPEGQGGGMVKG